MAEKKPTAKQLYAMKNEMLQDRFLKVTPYEFYRDVFPEGELEERGNMEDRKPNAIYTIVTYDEDGTRRGRNTIMFDDLRELQETEGVEFAVTSPVAYSGRNRTAERAYHLWGFCIDLDGVEMVHLTDLLHQIDNGILPEPTYLANSGHGMHVYYLLEEPIRLYSHLHRPLDDLKLGLTKIVWNKYTSAIEPEKRQFQGIFQGFRMPGTQSKLGKRYPVVVYRVGNKHTISYLNEFVEPQYRLQELEKYRLPLEEAKVKYPEWYQKRIVNGDKSRKKWNIGYRKKLKRKDYALYEWWLEQIRSGAFDGNRYNCIATLMTYAVKCDVDKERVLNDALELQPWLDSLTSTNDNAFTVQDVYDAFTYFDDCYATYSIRAIEAKTKISIPRNKRNGQKQNDHLEEARAIRDIRMKRQGRDWRNKDGRPKGSGTAEQKVAAYRSEHPEASVSEVARALQLSRPTVYKWWQSSPKPAEPLMFTPEGVRTARWPGVRMQKNESKSLKALKRSMEEE